jgi:hypothetical protein
MSGPLINVLYQDQAIVSEQGNMTQVMNTFADQVTENSLIIGTGTPETVIPANQGRFYMDETGLAGSVLFIKQLSDIGGDNKQGWVAIG